MATGIIMADVEGCTLNSKDVQFLQNDELGGIILFARNVDTPNSVRALTDSIRAINPNLVIAADQEGGRVARFRRGFSPLPAMGELGKRYDQNPKSALSLAYDVGYLMACEVLAVGVDFSFAPVLDIDGVSAVIGDRAFHKQTDIIIALSAQLMAGMHKAGMATTGKHFPGHGSVAPDSHVACAVDDRSFDEIWAVDGVPFMKNLAMLDAIMPAHVIFSKVDDKPAGFSSVWLQDILRQKLGFNGVIFSDDLSMKAAHVAGGVEQRVQAAIHAGCDMALVCNSRDDALKAIAFAKTLPSLSQSRFSRMKAKIPKWRGDLHSTCLQFDGWLDAKNRVAAAFFDNYPITKKDPTEYRLLT
ncbi:beta-N-acetylhexosaminidase [Moraxella nasovis]|uniref:beta-N-acetylhexosaminidase n=1 Tax=Moraxella nasovis TaxID=2904121 RepID=UPI001F623056|nr:beta-N-acetylhexosaminidase [Moraxella nasovis]UNU72743.1 beta-N-acetylhexosaminidase [Moraxella nasovis]